MKKLWMIAVLLALAALWPARTAAGEDGQKDLALLQGEWTMVSGSADGQPMPEGMRKLMKRVCKGSETTVLMGGQVFLKAKVTLDPSQKPKTIDYEMTGGYTKGEKQLGIYEVDENTFKACFGKPGAERPKDFTSNTGEGQTLSVWKRVQPTANTQAQPKP